jgi:translation initiation factor IF-2
VETTNVIPGGSAMEEKKIGVISHYFTKAQVAAIELTDGELSVGDTIRIKGHTSDFTQTVESMQIEHAAVEHAKIGDAVGIKVTEHAREQDIVFKVVP